MKYIIILLTALALAGCSDPSKAIPDIKKMYPSTIQAEVIERGPWDLYVYKKSDGTIWTIKTDGRAWGMPKQILKEDD